MFIPHPDLEHRERKLFAPEKFMKSIPPRLVSGFPQFILSSSLIKGASFHVSEKNRLPAA